MIPIHLTEQQEAYILDNHKSKSVAMMASEMEVSARFIYQFMYDKELTTLDRTIKRKDRRGDGKYFNVREFDNWLV